MSDKFGRIANATIIDAEWENPSAWAEKLMHDIAKGESGRQEAIQQLNDYIAQLKSDQALGKFDGATFVPHLSSSGDIWFTNDKGLTNPPERNIKGPQGENGACFPVQGYFSLSVDENGDLWQHYNTGSTYPPMEYDERSGALYITVDE